MIRRRILMSVLLVVLFGLGWKVGRGQATGRLYENLDLFVEILNRIENHYVDPIDPESLVDGAIRGMLAQLDPYSQYLDAKALTNLKTQTRGRFTGIGVVVSVRDGWPTVIAPIEGSPAWEAGMVAGDIIVRIEDRSTHGFSVEDAADLLRGAEGTDVRLTVRREGDDDEEYVLTRREIVTRSVPYAFVHESGVGYLRLANFSEHSGVEVREAVDRLRRDGAKSLILDLRMNPGGLLDQAVDVAEQFVPKGSRVVFTRGRSSGQEGVYRAEEATPETRWPMVALIDEGSASASEIVSGALQDLDRALVIGATSFGKGLVQSVFELRGRETALKLTTARYYTPSGRSIQREAPRTDGFDPEASAEEGDEIESQEAAPQDEQPPGTDERPVYRTQAGRPVYGGGGITPDIETRPDSLTPLARRIERRGLPARFASRWANGHPGEASVGTDGWAAFSAFLRAEESTATESALAAERSRIERLLLRELARRKGGEEAAARTMLQRDPAFLRAIDVLQRARNPRDVFASTDFSLPESRLPKSAPRRDAGARSTPESSGGGSQ